MQNEVKTPKNIADDAGIRINHVSKVLRELKDINAAECLNESAKKGRLYRLTPLGEEIAEHIDLNR